VFSVTTFDSKLGIGYIERIVTTRHGNDLFEILS
jgi:hypothetical protein